MNRLRKSLATLPSWALSELPLNHENIESYLNGTGSIGRAANEIFKHGMTEIGRVFRTPSNPPQSAASRRLALGFTNLLIADSILIKRLKHTQNVSFETLDGIVQVMFGVLATGDISLIAPFHSTVLSGLENGYGVRDGHTPPIGTTLRYAAFGLTIIGDWLGKPLDLDKHALPRDPAWGQLVAHWREPDPEKLLPILMAACDTHIERIALNSRELDSGNFEFGSPFEAVYPAEILAILNLRRSLKLPNPFIDHPLMTTPYAALTCPPGTRLERDELLERFLIAVCKYNPEAMPEGLYEAVLQKPPLG
ncbi:hypothetical protein [Pseudomonas mosselii]|uniref:hypothetical protein n=1 Tax=Pseudomonas mosselii TaxID=78327 RepID=UPI0021A5E1EB|nr:hypothetical protein [Pseudomonas mosselii]MEA3233616.1 hypothetical protein [Pseudomonas mosselii]UWS65014.1 hypothetical protein N0U38_14525 [Pseudomonas mosselii]